VTRRGRPANYEIAIPSSRRADRLATTTLAVLAAGGVELERVTVFVDAADPTRDAYDGLGVRVVALPSRGIGPARHAISQHYPPGTPVVCTEDDVTGIVASDGEKLRPVTELDGFFRGGFGVCSGVDLWAWGVNPVPNAFYMRKDRPTYGLRYLLGTLHGFYARPDHPVHAPPRVPVKEDYELSLRAWWWDGGVVRFPRHAVQADHYQAAGGCVATRTPADSERAAATLERDWPGLVRRNPRRASGHAEIVLTSKPRTGGHSPHALPPGIRSRQEVRS
jgi:hypothetical protein